MVRPPASDAGQGVIPTQAAHDDALTTLRLAAPRLHAQLRQPWWIIGSTALHLHGVGSTQPHDIDVLCSVDDADALIEAWADARDDAFSPADDARFRSRFARFHLGPLPLEIMGGLQLHRDGAWQAVQLHTRQHIAIDNAQSVPVPALEELQQLFVAFGRDKDLAKAECIRIHLSGATPHVH